MKTKIYSFLAIAFAVVTLSACTFTTGEFFDEPSTERAEATKAQLKSAICGAPNGWIMELYGDPTYGAYSVFCQFDEDSVVVASEKAGESHNAGVDEATGKLIRCKSNYTIDQSGGVILSFIGYNEIFHYYSDPRNADFGDDGDGFYGDFEFRVISISDELIEMRGRKHNYKVKMYRLADDETWEQRLAKNQETDTYMASRRYQLVVDGDTIASATTQHHGLVFSYNDTLGMAQKMVCPYALTPEGYRFYSEYELITEKGSLKFSGVEKGETDEYFLIKDNPNARLETYLPTLAESLETGMWFVGYDNLGAPAQQIWEDMRVKLKTAGLEGKPVRLYWSIIGTYNKKCGFHMQAGPDYCFYPFTFKAANEEGTQVDIKIGANASANKAGKDYYKSYGMKEVMALIGGTTTKAKRFNIETDNQRKPTYLKLTEVGNEENTYVLTADQVNYVYGDRDNYDVGDNE